MRLAVTVGAFCDADAIRCERAGLPRAASGAARCAAPGTIRYEVYPLSSLTAWLFDADGKDRPVELTEEVVRSLGDERLLWVDVDDREDESTNADVVRILGLRDVDVERVLTDSGRARLTRTSGLLHITLEALEAEHADDPRLIRREIDLLAAPNVVVTVHTGPVEALQRFHDGLEGETHLGALTAGDLMSALIDEVFVGYYLLAELTEREIDSLDQRALLGRPGDDILTAIVSLRRRISLMRRTLAPHRDALSTVGLPEMGTEAALGRPYPGLVDRLEGAMGAIEGLRDGLLGTFDIHMGRVSQRANDVMRTLTLLSAILLPAVVLAGIMGMNFRLAFFDEPTYFWYVLAGMVVMAVVILIVARWRHWL
jgi:Mg2+ and Co2+ transporter CorA